MKTIAYAALLAMFVTGLATPWCRVRASGPGASGTYSFVLGDELTKQVEFEATRDERGVTTGHMTFRDQATIHDEEIDSGERPEEPAPEFFMTAQLDSLTIENNRAVMGGTVRESSHPSYVGKWVQLVVEDNGDGQEVPDKLTWSFCKPQPGGWVPVDADDPRDEGAWWHWWATDADLRDDVGIPSVNVIPGTTVGCPSFSLSTYEFPETRGEGQIQVSP